MKSQHKLVSLNGLNVKPMQASGAQVTSSRKTGLSRSASEVLDRMAGTVNAMASGQPARAGTMTSQIFGRVERWKEASMEAMDAQQPAPTISAEALLSGAPMAGPSTQQGPRMEPGA